jgi:UDP:flavonoid glycosyltransferase YjiC (YdhE family)
MRVLFSSGALHGHVNTMLPLAHAARHAGHEVVVATGPDLTAHVERQGLPAWALGLTHAQAGGSRQASWLDYFAATAEARGAELLARARAWQPDVVVHEETELAGAVVAAATRARHVVHGLGLMPPARVWSPFVAAVERLAERLGEPGAALTRSDPTYLHICPPALQPPGPPIWQRTQVLRPSGGGGEVDEGFARCLAGLPFTQTVHVTPGTVFNRTGNVLAGIIAALREQPWNLVVTVGPDGDPSHMGPQPPHVLLERYVPHAGLLPHCDAVVSHGGAGVMFAALAHGLPQLTLPQGADQFMNAEACCRSGAGLSLASGDTSHGAIVAAVERLLADPALGTAARAVQSEIAAMPDADAVVGSWAGPSAARRGR